MHKSIHLLLLIVVLLFLTNIQTVFASLCEPLAASDIYEWADVVFVGTVVNREAVEFALTQRCWKYSTSKPACGSKVATFEVSEMIKGSVKGEVTVYSMDACYCTGSYLTKGDEYLVAAKKSTGKIQAKFSSKGVCYGTVNSASNSGKILLEKLREITKSLNRVPAMKLNLVD